MLDADFNKSYKMDAKHNLFLPKICGRYTIPLPRNVREPVGVKRVEGISLDILGHFPATELTTSVRKGKTKQRYSNPWTGHGTSHILCRSGMLSGTATYLP